MQILEFQSIESVRNSHAFLILIQIILVKD